MSSAIALLFSLTLAIASDCSQPGETEKWNAHFQTTTIPQGHGGFHSPYEGARSLSPDPEVETSFTSTAFVGVRLPGAIEFYFNPEVSAGKGISGVQGIAGFTNGETPRITTPEPHLYVARLYAVRSWGFGAHTACVEGGPNQLAGQTSANMFSVIVGRYSPTDFFDVNTYAHDPRSQFMNWALMSNGAWDYPADTRGYNNGVVGQFATPRWSLRFGAFTMPRVANGIRHDFHLAKNHGEAVEWEQHWGSGKLRLLGYQNHGNMGTYRGAITDIIATRRSGTLKYGFGLNLEQRLAPDIGIFSRLGWNDGKTESFAFTAIDRTASAGVSVTGSRWKRPHDTFAVATVFNGLSGDHASYLAAGGFDFIIGDGRLTYGVESIVESYYAWRLPRGFTLTGDYQHIWNPAYNQDRGPVTVISARLHWEL